MSDLFSFAKVLALAGGGLLGVLMVLLALPNSRLRSVALECAKYVLAAAVLVVSPIDFLPLLPIDDIGYLIGGFAAIRSAREEHRRRALTGSKKGVRHDR